MSAHGTYLERYLSGEHERVWDDLVTLGAAVRDEPAYTDALAVARETMRRARHNIEVLIARLTALGYEFGYRWLVGRERFSLAQLDELERHSPRQTMPTPETRHQIDELERRAGILPISLRTFFEVVGGVNLVGQHPEWGDYGLAALQIESAGQLLELDDWGHWTDDKDDLGNCNLPIAPDEHQRYFVSGNLNTVHLPAAGADAALDGEWHHTTFIGYMRICCRWGGLPGLERSSKLPAYELGLLTPDLLPL
jgi:hypothetical protein